MTEVHEQLETARLYARGRIDDAVAEAFEAHLLDCDQCQTEVRLIAGLGSVMKEAPPGRSTHRRQWIVGVLLAAGIAAILFLPRSDARVVALGQVGEPPAYAGMSVRTQQARADSIFSAAMAAYVARRYGAAAAGLRDALAAGIDTIPAEFFLASAQLMAGRASDAAAGYARVIAAGPAARHYLPEARFFRARALLQLNRADDALTELAAIDPGDETIAARASALADSVRQVRQR